MISRILEEHIRLWQQYPNSVDAILRLRETMSKEGVFEVIVADGATLDSPITEIKVENDDGTQQQT